MTLKNIGKADFKIKRATITVRSVSNSTFLNLESGATIAGKGNYVDLLRLINITKPLAEKDLESPDMYSFVGNYSPDVAINHDYTFVLKKEPEMTAFFVFEATTAEGDRLTTDSFDELCHSVS